MLKLNGLGVSPGIVTGPILIFEYSHKSESYATFKHDKNELDRFERALQRTRTDIRTTCDKLAKEGLKEGEILEAYLLILEDEELTGTVKSLISDKNMEAEQAVMEAFEKFSSMLREVKSKYISSRAKDIADLGNQVIRNMEQDKNLTISRIRPSIIVAKDLKASETAKLDEEFVLGIVTEEGSPISHVSILARALKIPAVINCLDILNKIKNGDIAYINGATGEVVINPGDDMMLF